MGIIQDIKQSNVFKKLFTHEDVADFGYNIRIPNVHKVFGYLSLLSFFYRYFVVFPKTGTLGFTGTTFDFLTIALHLALSSSSLVFHVLAKRILAKPMIIWNEYRLHAISFTMRCVSVFVHGYFRPLAHTNFEVVLVYCLVMAHHVAADIITHYLGMDNGQTTVRVDNTSTWYAKLVLRFYSFYQFLAIACHLTPFADNTTMMDMGFNTLIAIQSSAFLMTLFRKGLIHYYTHALFYTFALILSVNFMRVGTGDQFVYIAGKTFFAFVLRVVFSKLSKYAIWGLFSLSTLPFVEDHIMAFYKQADGAHTTLLASGVVPDAAKPLATKDNLTALVVFSLMALTFHVSNQHKPIPKKVEPISDKKNDDKKEEEVSHIIDDSDNRIVFEKDTPVAAK